MGWWSVFDWAATATVAVSLLYVLLRRPPRPLCPSLPVTLLIYLGWLIGDLGTTRDLEHPHLWLSLMHGVGVFATPGAFIVALRFAEAYGLPFSWGRQRWVYLPIAVSALLSLCIWTNPWHGAYLTPIPGSRSEYGPIALATGLYAHGMSIAVVVLFAVVRARHRSWLVRRKTNFMIAAWIAHPICNLTYVVWPTPLPFDPSVLAVMWSTGWVMVGVYRSGLFNPLPVALPQVIAGERDAVVLLDHGGYAFYANDAARDIFPAAAWLPEAPFDDYLEDCLARPAAPTPVPLPDAFGAPGLYHLRSDAERCLRLERSPICTRNGLEVGTCVRLHDVSALLRAHASIRSGEDRFRTLADHARDFVVEMSENGRILYANPRHAELFGEQRPPAGIVESAVFPGDREGMRQTFEKLMASGSAGDVVMRIWDRWGRLRWIEVAGSAFVAPGGEKRAVIIGRDVTSRQQEESARRRRETLAHEARRVEAVSNLTGGLAQELNEALAPILGHTNQLLEDLSPSSAFAEMLEEVEEASLRLAGVVAKLQACAGSAPLEIRRVPAESVLAGLRARLRLDPLRQQRVRFEMAAELPALDADAARLEGVLLELIGNALRGSACSEAPVVVRASEVRAAPEELPERTVRVGELRAGRYLRVEVRDAGPGMDRDQLTRSLEPFFSNRDGLGLGLAVAAGLVRAHGGALELESEIDRGTTARVWIPARS